MIPRITPQQLWLAPVEVAGGLRANYPIVTKDQQYGLFNEVSQDQIGIESGIYRPGGHGPQAWADKAVFNGEIWSLQQVNNEPGYYVTPQNLYEQGIEGATWSSGWADPWDIRPSGTSPNG